MLGAIATVGTAGCVFLIVVMARQGLDRSGAWAAPLAALAGIVAAVAAVSGPVARPPKVPVPPELEVAAWVVGRPAELAAVVKALVGRHAGTIGITTGLYGAGGFGKTTLARMVCADRRVRRHFGGRVYLVTVGRDARGAAAIAAKVNDVIKIVTGEDATFTDPRLAGARLGTLMDAGPRRLLVLDDVWEPEQLAPFTAGAKQCARLVTTRVPELLTGRGPTVRVDQMSPEQARALLTAGLPPLDEALVAGLLAVTGRWPLLLRLVGKILADYATVAADVSAQGQVLLERLQVAGPAAVDELSGSVSGLDVGEPGQRAKAVRATIEASTGLLDSPDVERFTELGVFAEDETIPFRLVARLWRATAGLDELAASQVCNRLARLALVSQTGVPAAGFGLHDVIRDFLRAELGQQRLAELNGKLLDAIASDLPAASPSLPDPDGPSMSQAAWWELTDADRYLWDHLIEHLLDAGRPQDANAVAGDLRWVGARLERFGPAAAAADLAVSDTPRAARQQVALARASHLLVPTEPARAVVDVLHSRIADDPDWGPQAAALRETCPRPRLVNRWPLPDLADPAFRRMLAGHTGAVTALAVAPDGSWLASGGFDGTVRIWDPVSWQERAAMAGHETDQLFGGVAALAVAPDGSWLASGGGDGTVRIWDPATGQERAATAAHAKGVTALAVAPDGSWLASGGSDGTVRIWDPATGQERAAMAGRKTNPFRGWVTALAVAADGSWLASGAQDGTVRVWDPASGQERTAMAGHLGGRVEVLAVAPDGSWLASGGHDRTVRVWDPASGQERAAMAGHETNFVGGVAALAVAPDGSWLASGGHDGMVRVWDPASGQERAAMAGHEASFVNGVDGVGGVAVLAVAPDGSWLASGGHDGAVRVWDPVSGQERAAMAGHEADFLGGVAALAVAPDGSWLASGGHDGTVRVWDPVSGQDRAAMAGHETNFVGGVAVLAVAPDSSWLASGGQDGMVRLWDPVSGRERAAMAGHEVGPLVSGVAVLAVAPDGSWLASGGSDGAVRVWDPVSGQERAAMAGHGPALSAGWQHWRWRRMAAGWPPAASTGRSASGIRSAGRSGRPWPGTGASLSAGWRFWRWRRMAAGWPPAVGTGRYGSGIRSAGRSGRPWPGTRPTLSAVSAGWRHWQWRRMAAGWPPVEGTGRCGSGIRSAGRSGRPWPGTGPTFSAGWRRWQWRRMAAGWPPAARTGWYGSGIRPAGRNGQS